ARYQDLDRVRRDLVAESIDRVLEQPLRNDFVGSTHQELECVQFARRERDDPTANLEMSCGRVEADISDIDRKTERSTRTAQERSQPGGELPHRKGLQQIVVRSAIKPRN